MVLKSGVVGFLSFSLVLKSVGCCRVPESLSWDLSRVLKSGVVGFLSLIQ